MTSVILCVSMYVNVDEIINSKFYIYKADL